MVRLNFLILRTAVLISACLLICDCGENDSSPAPDTNLEKASESSKKEVANSDDQKPQLERQATEKTTLEQVQHALVGVSVELDGISQSYTGILNFGVSRSNPTMDTNGRPVYQVAFPISNNATLPRSMKSKIAGKKDEYKIAGGLNKPLTDKNKDFTLFEALYYGPVEAIPLPMERASVKLGTEVIFLSAEPEQSPIPESEQKKISARLRIKELRSEINAFKSSVGMGVPPPNQSKPRFSQNSRTDRWDVESKFIEAPKAVLSPKEFEIYQTLRKELIEIRVILPRSDPTMRFAAVQGLLRQSATTNSFAKFRSLSTKAVVSAVTPDGDIEFTLKPGEQPPTSQSLAVVDETGRLMGMAVKSSPEAYRLKSFSGLAKMTKPSVTSVSVSMFEYDLAAGNYMAKLDIDASLGIGRWRSFHAIVISGEEETPFPIGEGAPAIFNPTDPDVAKEIQTLYLSNDRFMGNFIRKFKAPRGETTSFVGQIFAKDHQGNQLFFPPFRWGLARSIKGTSCSFRMEDHPFASIITPAKKELPEGFRPALFSPPTKLDYIGYPLQISLSGDRSKLIVRTDRPPFFFAIDLDREQISPLPLIKDPSVGNDIQMTVGGNHIYLLHPKDAKLQKWSIESESMILEKSLPGNENFKTIAVSSNNIEAPFFLISDKKLHTLDQDNLEEIPSRFSSRANAKIQDDYTFSPTETSSYFAQASADGMSYILNISKSKSNRATLFRPFDSTEAILYKSYFSTPNIGFNGDHHLAGYPYQKSQRVPISEEISRRCYVINIGGAGYFSKIQESRSYGRQIPMPNSIFRFFLPKITEPFFATAGLAESNAVIHNIGNPAIFFIPESRQLVTVPEVGGAIFIRKLTSDTGFDDATKVTRTFRFTSPKPKNATRGSIFSHQLTFLGKPENISLETAPSGLTLDPETFNLIWEVPENFVNENTKIIVTAIDSDGKKINHQIDLDIKGAAIAFASRRRNEAGEKPSPQNGTSRASKGITSTSIKSDLKILDVTPAAGCETLAVTYVNSPKIDLIDVKSATISATAMLAADSVLISANRESIFCYYPAHRVIERRSARTLKIEKSVVLDLETMLLFFETAESAPPSTPIFCIQEKTQRSAHPRFRFIDPQSLQFLPPQFEDSFLKVTESSESYQQRGFSISSDGSTVLSDGKAVRFSGRAPQAIFAGTDARSEGSSISIVGDSVLSNNVQTFLRSRKVINRTERSMNIFKFDSEGKYVLGYRFGRLGSTHRAVIEFFEVASSTPLIVLNRVEEFEIGRGDFDLFDDGERIQGPHRVYFSPIIDRLITIPWSNKEVIIRELGIEKLARELK